MNKDVCKHCTSVTMKAPWLEADDADWESGIIFCPICGIHYLSETEPPDECSFRMEHLLLEEKTT